MAPAVCLRPPPPPPWGGGGGGVGRAGRGGSLAGIAPLPRFQFLLIWETKNAGR